MSAGAPGDDFRFMPPEHMWKLARVIIQSWFSPMIRIPLILPGSRTSRSSEPWWEEQPSFRHDGGPIRKRGVT